VHSSRNIPFGKSCHVGAIVGDRARRGNIAKPWGVAATAQLAAGSHRVRETAIASGAVFL